MRGERDATDGTSWIVMLSKMLWSSQSLCVGGWETCLLGVSLVSGTVCGWYPDVRVPVRGR